MSIRHLTKGSVCPPLPDGILRVYNMRYCPYAQRTLLVLNAKQIDHEIVNVNAKRQPEWLTEKSPLGKLPALEHSKRVLYESIQTCDYLEETYPDPPLYPKDKWLKYTEKALVDYFDAEVINPMMRVLFRYNDPEKLPTHFEDMKKGFVIFERELAKRGTKFFGGDKPRMVDYMVWPWFERVPIIESFTQEELFTSEECPLLKSYMKEMRKDKTVKAVLVSEEDQKKYMLSVFQDKFIYDFDEEKANL